MRIDANFYGNSSSAFASLETLIFHDMPEWDEWECKTSAFPSLRYLSVSNCPKLKGHLSEHLSHLKYQTIDVCKQLEIEGVKMETSPFDMIGHHLHSLRIFFCSDMNILINHCYGFLVELHITQSCDSLANFPLDLFPKLRELDLVDCRNLQIISQGHPHRHLKSMRIEKCSEFELFPDEGLFAPQLEKFSIEGLEKLKLMPKRMSALLPSLNYLNINNCPGVELSDECLPFNLKHVYLLNCSKLVASLKKEVWGKNPYLEFLSVEKDDMEYFPDEGLLPQSLTELRIKDCLNLKKLDYRGLCHLSSLQKLFLSKCQILQCLPEEGLPESISQLIITDCPLLKQRYKK